MPKYLLHHTKGRLYDDAEANWNTFISRDSSAHDFAKLRDCTLTEDSHASQQCQIYGGTYAYSLIRGRTICAGNPLVKGSVLECSEVSGSAQIFNSQLYGNTEVCDSPHIEAVRLRDAIIYGNPVIHGDGETEVTGRVHEGTWTRAPRYIKLPWCSLSECIDDKILVNCYCRKSEFWYQHGRRVAAKWGWSEDMVSITLDRIGDIIKASQQSGENASLAQTTIPVIGAQDHGRTENTTPL